MPLNSTYACRRSNASCFSDIILFTSNVLVVDASPEVALLLWTLGPSRRGTWNQINRAKVRVARMISDQEERPCQYRSYLWQSIRRIKYWVINAQRQYSPRARSVGNDETNDHTLMQVGVELKMSH